ncbi:MAG: sulfotransferase [Candidatus Aegiribacteria sp.]|nr:sulfotransferase [Candidatus Aegiribacteria sp.]
MQKAKDTKTCRPEKSYIIWSSQRTGSTYLCRCLENSRVAGHPNEWLHTKENEPEALYAKYNCNEPCELQEAIWKNGLDANGVFGLKVGFSQPHHTKMMELFRQFPNCGRKGMDDIQVLDAVFPNCKHIWITRRNKVRLAVSWWKAIKSGEFHREYGAPPEAKDIGDEYLFEAIDHLYCEAVMREAGTQEFFFAAGIVPHTVVYEDFIADKASTLTSVLDYLGLTVPNDLGLANQSTEKLADDLSEAWVQRYREEKQRNWQNGGW